MIPPTMPGQPQPPQPLTISNEEVAYWLKEIQASIRRKKDEFDDIIEYDTLVRYFEGFQVKIGTKLDTVAILDEFATAIVAVIAGTYYQNPDITVKAAHPDADKPIQVSMMYLLQHPEFQPFSQAELLTGAMHYAAKKYGLKLEAQMGLFDLLVAGFCAIECNHRSVAPDQARTDLVDQTPLEAVTSGIGTVINKAMEMFGGKDGAMSTDEVEAKVAGETSDHTDMFQDQTYFKRWSPNEVLFDSQARTFKESRCVWKVVKMSLAQFKMDYPKFKDQIPAEFITQDQSDIKRKDENKKQVTIYEGEIKQKDGSVNVLCITKGIKEALDYHKRAVITNDFTIKYGSIDKYGKIYPVSRAKKAKKPQDDLNHYATIQFEHADRSPRKVAVFMQGLSVAGQTTQKNSEVYGLVEKVIPGNVYEAMPQLPVSPDNKELQINMKDSINKHIGTSEVNKAGGQSDNKLLGQDQLENMAFQASTNQVQDALADVLREVLDTCKDIIMQFWDGQDYFMVTGLPGGDAWYDPAMGPLADLLLGDFSIETDITTAERKNPLKEQKDSIEYAQLVTSPQMLTFAAMHGKRPSMDVLKKLAKSFGQNPDVAYENIPMPPPMPGGPMPMPGNGPIPIPSHLPQKEMANV